MLARDIPSLLARLLTISSTLAFPLYAQNTVRDDLITDITFTTP